MDDEPAPHVGATDAVRPGAEPAVERWERRFFWPVLLATFVSLPAMYLTMRGGSAATAGTAVNVVSMLVFAAETMVLLALTSDKRRWVKKNWYVLGVTVLTVPAVLLALGPVQLLRLLRIVGTLRIIRAARIIKAGRILYERSSLSGPLYKVLAGAVTVAAAVFVGLVLADPTAYWRRALETAFGDAWLAATAVAAAILAAATFVVARHRWMRTTAVPEEPPVPEGAAAGSVEPGH